MRSACVLLLLAGLASAKRGANLLENGGFEQELEGWTVNASTGQAKFEVDTRTKKKGKRSLRVTKTGKFSHGDGCYYDFDLPARAEGGRIRMSARVKAKKLKNAWLRMQLMDASGGYLLEDSDLHSPAINGTFNWRKFEKTWDVPPGAKRGRIILDVYYGQTIWLDQIEVVHTPSKRKRKKRGPALTLENGTFDRSADGWQPLHAPAKGTLGFKVDRKVEALRLTRETSRLLPQEGVHADVSEIGRAKRVTLSCRVRVGAGARAVVALLAFNKYDAFLDIGRKEVRETGEAFTPQSVELTLPRGTTRLRVALAIEGSGSVWFDDVALKGK
jgi:hypothetical protein